MQTVKGSRIPYIPDFIPKGFKFLEMQLK